jgi:mannose/fructose/N-acetylgalactosamine-specific phosphotransferase system component IID
MVLNTTFNHAMCPLILNLYDQDQESRKQRLTNIKALAYKTNMTVGNHISDVIVSVLASSMVDREFELCSGQTKDYLLFLR